MAPTGTPSARAVAILEKLGVPLDRAISVIRKNVEVKFTAHALWTNLLANPKALRRAQQALGVDESWDTVASPMSFQAIADAEGVTRNAVTVQLRGFGIAEPTVNRALAGHSLARSNSAYMEDRSDESLDGSGETDGTTSLSGSEDDREGSREGPSGGKKQSTNTSRESIEAAEADESRASLDMDTGENSQIVPGYRIVGTAAKAMGEGLVSDGNDISPERRAQAVKKAHFAHQYRDLPERAAQTKALIDGYVKRRETNLPYVRVFLDTLARLEVKSGVTSSIAAKPETDEQSAAKAADLVVARARAKEVAAMESARQLVENQRRATEAAERRFAKELNSTDAVSAAEDWNDGKDDNSPTYAELHPGVRAAWVQEHSTQSHRTGNEWEPIDRLIKQYERELTNDDYTKSPGVGEDTGTNQGVGSSNGTEQSRAERNPGAVVGKNADIILGDTEQSNSSERTGAAGSRGRSDAVGLQSELKAFMRVDALGRLINVVQSVSDLPFTPAQARAAGITAKTQGLVYKGKAYLVADNIAPGKARAVFMHEVGSHLGLQNLLTSGEFDTLVDRVLTWASQPHDSVEKTIALRAMARVVAAKTNLAQYNTELVAYTLEEATLAGFNPQAAGKEGPVKAWLRQLFTAFKQVLAKLGANPDRFNMQDLVDLAYGAAQAVHTMEARATATDEVQQSQSSPLPDGPGVAQVNTAQTKMAGYWKDFMDTAKEAGNWTAIRTMFTHDLVALAAKAMPAARGYYDRMSEVQAEKTRMERGISDILEDFRKLSSTEQGTGPGSVNALLKDSTMTKKWAFSPDWLTGAKNADGTTAPVKVDAAMAVRFNALTPAARALVKAVFRHGHESLKQMQEAVMANTASEFDPAIKAAEVAGNAEELKTLRADKARSLKSYDSLMAMRGSWPYTPLKRFGNHAVLGLSQRYLDASRANDNALMEKLQGDSAHYHVSFHDTAREARHEAAKMQAKFPGGYVESAEKNLDANLVYGGRDALSSFRRLRSLVSDLADTDTGAAKGGNAAMTKLMRDMHLTLMSETSARKAETTRHNVAGADNDMMRAFATQGRAVAHFTAGLKTNGKVQDELDTLKQQASEHRPGRTERQAHYNELLRRHLMSLDYKPTPFIDKAMSAASVWMLMTNPAYYLNNLLQPAMMSHPMLAGKHGYARSASAMFKAYQDLGPLLKSGGVTEKGYALLPADVRSMIDTLANKGRIDIALEQDLGSFESQSASKLRVLDQVMSKMRGVSQTVESVNRLSTAIAAFRLEKSRGMSDAVATAYADKVVYETHGDYTGFNAPRFMRTGVMRLGTQFRKFQLIQLSMFAKLTHDSFAAASPEEKLVARKALAFNLTHLLAMGGVMGLPGFSAIAWVVGKAFPNDDEPDDPEATLRRAIGDKSLADMILKGMPKLAGVDMGKVGAGGMLSILPYAEADLTKKGYNEAVVGLMGPFVGGLMPKAVDGLGLLARGLSRGQAGDTVKGLEQLLPNGLSNAVKGARLAHSGMTTRNGDTVLNADEISVFDGIMQAVGLPTNTLTDRAFLSNAKFKADAFYKDRTTEIKQAYTHAYLNNDSEALQEARAAWSQTQEARRGLGYATQPWSMLLRAPHEKAKREHNVLGGIEVNKGNRGVVAKLQE